MSLDQFRAKDTDTATELESLRTQHLQKYLQSQGLYESTEEAQLREEVLGHLDQIVKEWVRGVARHLGLSESVAQEANATIFTFGSYRLGVHAPGADIDVLCVGPQYAKREHHFFGSQPYCLEQVLAGVPGVQEITAVAEAYVPVMKIKFKGVEMDVLYASLAQFLIPENLDLSHNSVLRGCDEQSVRSLNGCRVTDTILRSVPDVSTFRLALKAVKLWAEKRGVYSNVSGYLGGVNMALLVAKICKWYPRKLACTIVMMVFMHFTTKYWRWPDAVHLVPQKDDPSMGLPVWNPMDDRDRKSLMPIITPVYPAMNSTHNVTRCTMFVMMQEFERAFEICKSILFSPRNTTDWSPLFEPLAFFEVPKAFYVLIELIANNSGDMEKWDGWVRSRVRHLVRVLEEHANVRPFPESKSAPSEEHPEDSRPRKYYFLCITKRSPQLDEVNPNGMTAPKTYSLQRNAGATQGPAKTSINITQPIRNFTEQVRAWKDAREGMEVRPLVKRQADLPAWAFPQGYNPLLRRKQAAGTADAAPAAAAAPQPTKPAGASSAGASAPVAAAGAAAAAAPGAGMSAEVTTASGADGEGVGDSTSAGNVAATGPTGAAATASPAQSAQPVLESRQLSAAAAAAQPSRVLRQHQQQQQQQQAGVQGVVGQKRVRQEEEEAPQQQQQQEEHGQQGPGSAACTLSRVSTPELLAAEADAKIVNSGQDHYADWLGQTVAHMAPGQDSSQQQQGQLQGTDSQSHAEMSSTNVGTATTSASASQQEQQQHQQQAAVGQGLNGGQHEGAGAGGPQLAKKPRGLTFNLSKPTSL
mmetsp:Transcript_2836/g.7407  ORF Transcript_2836/g.7407 Transcript_2836/m.7407 type:complete len:812 (+) Transcript_2836:78-2513(+)